MYALYKIKHSYKLVNYEIISVICGQNTKC